MVKGTKPEQNEKRRRKHQKRKKRHKLDPIHVQQMRHGSFFSFMNIRI